MKKEEDKTLCIVALVHDPIHDTYSIVLNSEKCTLLPYHDLPRERDNVRQRGKTFFVCDIDMRPVWELICFDYTIPPLYG